MNYINSNSWGNTTLGAGVMLRSYNIPSADFGGINLGLIPEISNISSSNAAPIPSTQELNASEIEIGKKALQHFQDQASKYEDYGYSNIIELAAHYTKFPDIFFEGIGGAIVSMGEFLNDEKVKSAMYALADRGQGKVPVSMTVFFQKLGEIASNPSLAESITYTSTKALDDIGVGLVEFAESSKASLKSANFLFQYWPYIALLAGALFIFAYARSVGAGHAKALGQVKGLK